MLGSQDCLRGNDRTWNNLEIIAEYNLLRFPFGVYLVELKNKGRKCRKMVLVLLQESDSEN